jgi:hypothetical protein
MAKNKVAALRPGRENVWQEAKKEFFSGQEL